MGGLTEIISLTRETTQGVRMLKSFQLEDILHKRMSASIAAVEDMRNRLSRVKALVAPVSERGFERRRDRCGGALRVAEQPQQSGEHRRTVLVHHGPPFAV